jgi:hypothetical protein
VMWDKGDVDFDLGVIEKLEEERYPSRETAVVFRCDMRFGGIDENEVTKGVEILNGMRGFYRVLELLDCTATRQAIL